MNSILTKIIRNEHQRLKYQQLEDLASEVDQDVIVELGTHLGYGAIALCTGATVPVYTVDDYRRRVGWAGENYFPYDKNRLLENCQLAKVYPITLQYDARELGENWFKIWLEYHSPNDPMPNIELLVWDLGIPARLCEDFDAWSPHITGKFVIHDTDDNRLGSDLLNPAGWTKQKDGVFWILEQYIKG